MADLFSLLTTDRHWLVNRPFDLFDERDVADLFGYLSEFGQDPFYTVNLCLMPTNEEHRKKYSNGSKKIKFIERHARDMTEYVMDVIGLCTRENIPMILLLVVYWDGYDLTIKSKLINYIYLSIYLILNSKLGTGPHPLGDRVKFRY